MFPQTLDVLKKVLTGNSWEYKLDIEMTSLTDDYDFRSHSKNHVDLYREQKTLDYLSSEQNSGKSWQKWPLDYI